MKNVEFKAFSLIFISKTTFGLFTVQKKIKELEILHYP